MNIYDLITMFPLSAEPQNLYIGSSDVNDFYNFVDRLDIVVNGSNDIEYGGYQGTCGWKDATAFTLTANTDYTFVVNGYTDGSTESGSTTNVIGLSEDGLSIGVEYGQIYFTDTQSEQRVLVNVPTDTTVYVGGRPGATSTLATYAQYALYEGDLT